MKKIKNIPQFLCLFVFVFPCVNLLKRICKFKSWGNNLNYSFSSVLFHHFYKLNWNRTPNFISSLYFGV